MGWVSESSYLYVWGNGGGVTHRSRNLKPTSPLPDPAPAPEPDGPDDGDDDGKDE